MKGLFNILVSCMCKFWEWFGVVYRVDRIVYSRVEQFVVILEVLIKKTTRSNLMYTILSKLYIAPKNFQKFYMQDTNVPQSFTYLTVLPLMMVQQSPKHVAVIGLFNIIVNVRAFVHFLVWIVLIIYSDSFFLYQISTTQYWTCGQPNRQLHVGRSADQRR